MVVLVLVTSSRAIHEFVFLRGNNGKTGAGAKAHLHFLPVSRP
jgi:hypothetical protein